MTLLSNHLVLETLRDTLRRVEGIREPKRVIVIELAQLLRDRIDELESDQKVPNPS
jgi:hypothetical protein